MRRARFAVICAAGLSLVCAALGPLQAAPRSGKPLRPAPDHMTVAPAQQALVDPADIFIPGHVPSGDAFRQAGRANAYYVALNVDSKGLFGQLPAKCASDAGFWRFAKALLGIRRARSFGIVAEVTAPGQPAALIPLFAVSSGDVESGYCKDTTGGAANMLGGRVVTPFLKVGRDFRLTVDLKIVAETDANSKAFQRLFAVAQTALGITGGSGFFSVARQIVDTPAVPQLLDESLASAMKSLSVGAMGLTLGTSQGLADQYMFDIDRYVTGAPGPGKSITLSLVYKRSAYAERNDPDPDYPEDSADALSAWVLEKNEVGKLGDNVLAHLGYRSPEEFVQALPRDKAALPGAMRDACQKVEYYLASDLDLTTKDRKLGKFYVLDLLGYFKSFRKDPLLRNAVTTDCFDIDDSALVHRTRGLERMADPVDDILSELVRALRADGAAEDGEDYFARDFAVTVEAGALIPPVLRDRLKDETGWTPKLTSIEDRAMAIAFLKSLVAEGRNCGRLGARDIQGEVKLGFWARPKNIAQVSTDPAFEGYVLLGDEPRLTIPLLVAFQELTHHLQFGHVTLAEPDAILENVNSGVETQWISLSGAQCPAIQKLPFAPSQ